MRMLPLISVSIYPGQTLCEKIVFRIQWFKGFTKTFLSIMRALDVIPRNVINCVHVNPSNANSTKWSNTKTIRRQIAGEFFEFL